MLLYKNGFEDTKQEALEDSVQQALGVETVGGAQFRRQRGGHLNCVQLGSSLLSVDVTYRVTLVWCDPVYITIDVLFPTS